MKVLICEENATVALDLWWLLHEQGHSVCGIVRSTSDCLEKVAQKEPDLVLVDDNLQHGLTGSSLVETLAMSGFPSVILAWEPHAVSPTSSARAVLQKPFSEAALASAMARVERRDIRQVAAEQAQKKGSQALSSNAEINGVWAPIDKMAPEEWDRMINSPPEARYPAEGPALLGCLLNLGECAEALWPLRRAQASGSPLAVWIDARLGPRQTLASLRSAVEAEGLGIVPDPHERLCQILDRTVSFAALLTPDGVLKHVSQNALDAAGLSRDDVIGLPFWGTYWWSHDGKVQERLQKAIRDAQAGQTSRYDEVVRIINNGRLHIAFQLSPIVDRSGRVTELVASAFDITERVASQQKLEELVREMGHRIKNLLTTVRAMARMSQRASEPEAAFREFSGRLEALSAAHDALNDSETAEAFFEHLARRLLRPYRMLPGARLAISGPRLRLAPTEAKMLALCLHELATNAIKYGALSNGEGRVSVALSEPDEQGQITFTWTETGGPPVVPPSRQGYGTRYITSTLQGLFGGKVSVDYRPEGLCLSVSGPAPSLFSPADSSA